MSSYRKSSRLSIVHAKKIIVRRVRFSYGRGGRKIRDIGRAVACGMDFIFQDFLFTLSSIGKSKSLFGLRTQMNAINWKPQYTTLNIGHRGILLKKILMANYVQLTFEDYGGF